MEELTLAVVGIDFLNANGSNRRFEIALCSPGDPIELRPEPENKYDHSAIAVWRPGGEQIGYITAERCGWIGARMQAEGAVAIYQSLWGPAAYIRVRFGGGAPTLPPAPPADREPPAGPGPVLDFYPDPDGPEWGA